MRRGNRVPPGPSFKARLLHSKVISGAETGDVGKVSSTHVQLSGEVPFAAGSLFVRDSSSFDSRSRGGRDGSLSCCIFFLIFRPCFY